METFGTVNGCGCTRSTFELCNLNAGTKSINDILCSQFCTEYVIGCDLTVNCYTIYCTVNCDYAYALCHCGFNCTCYSVGITRVNDKYADAFSNKVFYVTYLLCYVITCVYYRKFNAKFISRFFRTLCKCYEERVVLCGYRKTDGTITYDLNRLTCCCKAVYVFSSYKSNFYRDGCRDGLASNKFHSVINCCASDQCRLLSNCTSHTSVFDCCDSIVCCVKAHYDDIFACTGDCLYCTESHLIVCCEYSLDIAVSLKHVLHYAHTFSTVEVCCLFSYNFKFFIRNIVETCGTVDGSGCTRSTFQLCNLDAFAECIYDVLCSKFCTKYVIRCDLTVNFNTVYSTVNCDNFNALRLSSFNSTCYSVGVTRVNDKNADSLGNKVFNVTYLLCYVITCVYYGQGNAMFCSCFFSTFNESYEERVILCGYRKTNGTGSNSLIGCNAFFTVNYDTARCEAQYKSHAQN